MCTFKFGATWGGWAKFAKDTFSFNEPLYKKSTWQQEKKKKIGKNNGPPTSLPVDAKTSINCNADAHAKIVLSCCYFCQARSYTKFQTPKIICDKKK